MNKKIEAIFVSQKLTEIIHPPFEDRPFLSRPFENLPPTLLYTALLRSRAFLLPVVSVFVVLPRIKP